jgi:prepilin-type N-terminal cleavage/methylation domain-containing protein
MNQRRRGFTLAELLLVMVVVGIVMGLGVGTIDRMDPGARGLQTTIEAFVQSSRDRARATGQNVVLQLEKDNPEDPGRFVRLVYRRVLEATFEPQYAEREGLETIGGARLEGPGRYGNGADLRQGGGVNVLGRGGKFDSPQGLQLELDFKLDELASGKLIVWKDLVEVSLRRDGSVMMRAVYGDAEGKSWADHDLASPNGQLSPGQWQHFRGVARDGQMQIFLDGRLIAESEVQGRLAASDAPPFLGDPDGRISGQLDEFQVWGLAREIGPELSSSHEVFVGALQVVFNRFGRLDAARHPEGVEVRIANLGQEIGAFHIGTFSEEILP